jgi:glycosyltransferase involved in cell wall biosynthesis
MSVRKICIVGMDAWGLLSGEGDLKYIGGESVQHVLLARAWRDLGYEVSIVVHDEGQGRIRKVDGITAIAAHRRNEGWPVLRFLHPRASKLVSALTKAEADVYYQSPAGAFTGITAWFCRMTNRRFIFRVASDSDVSPAHARIRFWRDRKLFEYGMRRADLIAAQTDFQVAELARVHRLESTVVNMMVEPPRRDASLVKDIDVLWVGNLRAVKRPELALELARQLSAVKFAVVGGPMPGGDTYYEDMRAAAARLPNVSMLGAVRYSDTGAIFDRAKVFLNTSSVEGFPNTFLQAWVRGVPVVTFFDPDSLVQRMQLGVVAASLDEMREGLTTLLGTDHYRDLIARRAREFALREFTTGVANRYIELITNKRQRESLGATDKGALP